MTQRRQLIRKVEGSHALLGACLVAAAAVFLAAGLWWSLGVGALIGAANFRAMALLTDRLTRPDREQRGGTGLLMAGKLIGLIASIGLTLWWLEPNPAALVVGLSLAPACLMAVAAIELGSKNALDRGGREAGPTTGEVM